MKNNKKLAKILFISIFMCMLSILTLNLNVYAAEPGGGSTGGGETEPSGPEEPEEPPVVQLIVVNDNVVNDTTTVEELEEMFGTPVAVSDSAFGGKAYSYTDDQYTWYVHIETNSDGKIMAYGAINGNFVAKKYSYNDVYDNRTGYLAGNVLTEWSPKSIYGIYEYNCNSSDVTNYWANYQEDSSKYLKGLQKHCILVSKVLAKKNNLPFLQEEISDDIFYRNEQLKYNNSSLDSYALENGKSKTIMQYGYRYQEFSECLPNPILLGYLTNQYNIAETYRYALFDVDIISYANSPTTSYIKLLYIDPNFLQEREKVDFTEEENSRLESVKELYKQYLEYGAKIGSSMFEENPVYNELPLVAGKYSDDALQYATTWINIARAGLGLKLFTLDNDIADSAQKKATLVQYANSKKLPADHEMPKPEGVDQDFYDKAQKYLTENLFYGNIILSVTNALNDGAGDPTGCAHRYNLLEPNYTRWGVGAVGSGISYNWQGCHKFSGYLASDTELVAWPSNGIFPLDMISNSIGNWTAKFYKNYTVSSDTEVTIECLNTGAKYEITKANKNKGGKVLTASSNSLLTFNDSNIVYEDGDVFKITLHNVKDSSGNTTDYTYRSVFVNLDMRTAVEAQEIKVNQESFTMDIGDTDRILATVMPEETSNKLMDFSSSDDDIVSVTQNGIITAKALGEVKITITCGNITKQVTVTVDGPIVDPDDITLNKDRFEMKVGDTDKIIATVEPDTATVKTVKYAVSSGEGIVSVQQDGTITALAKGNAEITVSCGAISKKVTVIVTEVLPTDIQLNKTNFEMKVGDTDRIIATVVPGNTTNKTIKYSVSSGDGVVSVQQDGTITALTEGNAKITVSCGNISKQVSVNVTAQPVVKQANGDMDLDGKVNSTDAALVLDRYKNNDATDIDMARGDMDGQGQLNSEDAAAILNIFKSSEENN